MKRATGNQKALTAVVIQKGNVMMKLQLTRLPRLTVEREREIVVRVFEVHRRHRLRMNLLLCRRIYKPLKTCHRWWRDLSSRGKDLRKNFEFCKFRDKPRVISSKPPGISRAAPPPTASRTQELFQRKSLRWLLGIRLP